MNTILQRSIACLFMGLSLTLAACGDSGGKGRASVGTSSSGGGSGGTGSNLAPTARNDAVTVQSGSNAVPLNVLANDNDPDGDTLTITSISSGRSNGAPVTSLPNVSIAGDGRSLLYTPSAGFIGVEPITYTITDGRGHNAQAVALVTVLPIPVPSAAVPDTFTVVNNGSAVSLDVLANDIDGAGGGLTLTAVARVLSVPPNSTGALSVSSNRVSYTPASGFIGVETLQYTFRDANNATYTGNAVVTVSPLAAPPVVLPDVGTVAAGNSLQLDVLANDVDFAGSGLTVTSVTPVATVPPGNSGTFTVVANGVRYVAPANAVAAIETAQYTVTDGNGSTATGLITVAVTPIAIAVPPVAVADVVTLGSDAGTVTLNVLANDLDPSGSGLTVQAASIVAALPLDPALTANVVNGALQLTVPNGYVGLVTLSYTAVDANGGTAVAPVVVTVSPLAAPPVAIPDVAVAPLGATALTLDSVANDIDPAAQGLTLSELSVIAALPPASTTATIVNNQAAVGWPSGFAGVITLSYTATDANGATATGLITVTVLPTLAVIPPVAVPDLGIAPANTTSMTLAVLSNDVDPSGSGLSVTAASILTGLPPGAVTANVVNDELVIAWPIGYVGVITAQYTATAGDGGSATGLVTVTVPPGLPVAVPVPLPDLATVSQDSSGSDIDVLANDLDPSNTGLTLDTASVALSVPMASHSVSVVNGQVRFVPAAGFAGAVTVNYTVSAGGQSAPGVLVITVTPTLPLPLPIALPDVVTYSGLLGLGSTQNINVLANDIDPAGSGLTLSGASITASVPLNPGSVSIVGNQLRLTLNAGYLGVITITYTATDANGGTATGVVTATVLP